MNAEKMEPAEAFGFEEYISFPVRDGSRTTSIHDESWERLQQLVRATVETEGPVHEARVIDVIRRTYGAGRAGRQIREIIFTAIEEEEAAGTIEWKAGVDGKATLFLDRPGRPRRTPPRRAPSDGAREIEHIWPGELESGLLHVVDACFGIDREEAVTATARAFGFSRVGETIREALNSIVDSLVESGVVLETEAGLTVNEG